MRPRDRSYHVERARAELDAAYRAERSGIAAIHLRLCALHMEQARVLADQPASEGEGELQWIERCRPLHESCLTS